MSKRIRWPWVILIFNDIKIKLLGLLLCMLFFSCFKLDWSLWLNLNVFPLTYWFSANSIYQFTHLRFICNNVASGYYLSWIGLDIRNQKNLSLRFTNSFIKICWQFCVIFVFIITYFVSAYLLCILSCIEIIWSNSSGWLRLIFDFRLKLKTKGLSWDQL